MRQRVVLLTRPTAKQNFVARYGTEGQTKFMLKQSLRGQMDLDKAEVEDTAQSRAVSRIRKALPRDVKLVEIDRHRCGTAHRHDLGGLIRFSFEFPSQDLYVCGGFDSESDAITTDLRDNQNDVVTDD